MRLQREAGLEEVEIIVEAAGWTAALPDAERQVARAAEAALAGCREAGHWTTAILLADDALVRDLNHRFRGQDKPTNVLSFPAGEEGAPPERPRQRGDVVLAFETVAREAEAQGKTLADHLSHLVVHGLLHLLGHDHEEPEEAEDMEALERRLLAGIGIADPYEAERPR